MKFGPVPVESAAGAVLAHSLLLGGRALRKGRTLSDADVALLVAAGIDEVTVARLDPDDLDEDTAAARIAAALVRDPGAAALRLAAPFTGRVNLHAEVAGIVELDADAICRLNAVDPAITLATLPQFLRVVPDQMVATVKIITYGVSRTKAEAAEAAAAGALRVRPVSLRRAGLILTEIPGQPRKLREKARRAVATRLRALGMELADCLSTPHETAALAGAITRVDADLILILTGSATSDPGDVGPEAVRAAGGRVTRFGMPVDPGNLLFMGEQGGRPVIGLPGCARSPALNGADWVLERIACGIDLTAADIAAMGVGGLLKESPARPHPRTKGPG